MTDLVRVRAFANIALAKYWGKQDGAMNTPATPSLALAIDCLATETKIEASDQDSFRLANNDDAKARNRVMRALDRWRSVTGETAHYRVTSENRFPTGAGLASSSSGMAALGAALNTISGQPLDGARLVRWVRRLSGSAARSLTGGLSVLPIGPDPAAEQVMAADEVPWGMVIVVVRNRRKRIGSTEAMEQCRLTSPYYTSWLQTAEADYSGMLHAVERGDFTKLGELTERNGLAMHACAIASRPALIYWEAATLRLLEAARESRRSGLECYFTADAGPNAALLARRDDLERVAEAVRPIEGVKQVMLGNAAGPVEVLECR